MVKRRVFVSACTVAMISVAAPASAIECVNGDQRVRGALIATPYCQEEQLAAVARGYGFKASADAIRNNPHVKRDICRFVGRDIRVQTTCSDSSGSGRGGRF